MARDGAGKRGGPTLLCVANFPSNTGFAWTFIERLYAGVAERLAHRGIRTLVAYPELGRPPSSLEGSPAIAMELRVSLDDARSLRKLWRVVRAENIRALYMADREAWHPVYPFLRAAGVRHIVVHDHTSGSRTSPRGLKRVLKAASRRIPGTLADRVLAVSGYVRERAIQVNLVPPERVQVVHNAIEQEPPIPRNTLRELFSIAPTRLVVACACRAAPEKGVHHLFRAFERLAGAEEPGAEQAVLVYMGDGPYLPELRRLRDQLEARERIILAGYRDDAAALVGTADICVVPSVWQEAFGLAALEPMIHGVPVIASRVGGIPEIVADGETGLLVAPGDEGELMDAMKALLQDPGRRRTLGRRAVERARAFDLESQVDTITNCLLGPWVTASLAQVPRGSGRSG